MKFFSSINTSPINHFFLPTNSIFFLQLALQYNSFINNLFYNFSTLYNYFTYTYIHNYNSSIYILSTLLSTYTIHYPMYTFHLY